MLSIYSKANEKFTLEQSKLQTLASLKSLPYVLP